MTTEADIHEFIGIRASQRGDWKFWLASVLAAQKERLFLFSPVVTGIGICFYFGLRTEPSWVASVIPFAASSILLSGLWTRRLNNLASYLAFLLVMALFLGSLGFALAKLRTMLVSTPILEKSLGPVGVEGRIANIEFLEEGRGLRLILKDLLIERLPPEKHPYSIRLKVRHAGDMRPGDRISVLAELNPPSAPVAPGAFDFQRFAYFKQIGAFGFAYKDPIVIRKADDEVSLWLEHLRQKVGERVIKAMPAREAGIANALMTGERAAISEQDMKEMRNSGLVHIISISGLHISMIAGVIFFTVRFLMACFPTFAVYHPIKKYAAVIALIITVLYMFMVGATVPTVRSVITTAIVLLAVMLDRIPVSLRLVAIAALTIMVLVPEALTGASFQMSFAAVMGLVAFYESTRTYWVELYRHSGWCRRGLIYLAGICLTTVIASIATAPFSIYHFQQFANYGLLANLLAVPLVSFVVMPAALLAYALMPLGLDGPVLWVMGKGLSGMLWVSHTVSNLPHAVWNPPSWPVSALLSFALAGILVCLLQGWGKAMALVPLCAGLIFVLSWRQPDILISESGKLVAVRTDNDEIYLSNSRAEQFIAEAWIRLMGHGEQKARSFRESPFLCDEWGCRYEKNEQKIAIDFHPDGHAEDCAWADILIANDPVKVRSCKAAVVIDRFDLWREGSHAVWVKDGRIQSVMDHRGQRPWTVGNIR